MRLLLLLSLLFAPLQVAAAAPGAPGLQILRKRIHSLAGILRSGRVEEALRSGEAIRAELAGAEGLEPEWVGFLRLYRFKALYQARRWSEAYTLAFAPSPLPHSLAPANEAYMASVMAELAVRLSKPPEEVLRWGSLAADQRALAGDEANALLACANACDALALLDAEPLCEPLARRLVAGGKSRGEPRWVIDGYSRLVDGAYRSGKRESLPQLRAQLLTDTRDVELASPQEDARDRLLERMQGEAELPSNHDQLMLMRRR